MGSETGIAWTNSTWTPVKARRKDTGKVGVHCVKVSQECTHCYSETFNKRHLPSHGTGLPFTVLSGHQVDIFLDDKTLFEPLKWRKPRRIFVCSQTDLFADFVTNQMIDRVFAVMARCPHHTFQVLTKRAVRMRKYLTTYNWPYKHIWLGVTAGTQETANERIPHLLNTPASVRFVSVEPQLEPVDLSRIELTPPESAGGPCLINSLAGKFLTGGGVGRCGKVDWVIVGGESGAGARPFNLQWARDLRDQCRSAGCAFFLKQVGSKSIWPPEPISNGVVGGNLKLKSRAGSDPEEWPVDLQNSQAFPEPA